MANSITAELAALRADIAEVLSYLRPPVDDVDPDVVPEVLPEEVPEVTGVKFVDGQLVDVPKGKDK